MLTTITLALGVNVAFFVVLPFDQLTNKLAGPFAEVVDPASGILKPILCLMISFCCLGSCNGIMMGSSRIIAAAGENGDIPACFSWKTKRHGTPYVALIAFAVYTSVMAFAMNLDDTVDFYTVGQWTFFVLIGISIYVLRRKFPDVRRPFKVSVRFLRLIPALTDARTGNRIPCCTGSLRCCQRVRRRCHIRTGWVGGARCRAGRRCDHGRRVRRLLRPTYAPSCQGCRRRVDGRRQGPGRASHPGCRCGRLSTTPPSVGHYS